MSKPRHQLSHFGCLIVKEEDEVDSDIDLSHYDQEDEEDELDDVLLIDEPESLQMNKSYNYVIMTVRKYVRIFRKSPLKLAQFKKNVLETYGKELTLILDCKTRWNSVLPMLERFFELKSIIKSTMLELNYDYDDNIEVQIFEIIQCLKPVQETIKQLSSATCDLMIAEATCIYLLTALENLSSEVGLKLFNSMKKRIEERRNIELISTMIFLHSGEYPHDNQFFEYSTKSTIHKKIKQLHLRLFNQLPDENEDTPRTSSNMNLNLNDTIVNFMSKDFVRLNIDSDLKAFQGTKERTERLDKIFNALKTIQATSTEVERTFSVAGNIKTKIRSRLSEQHLDMLIHLKYHFLSNNK